MGDRTGIAWTDATWNPVRGCSRVSEGCRHCYAEQVAARFSKPGQPYAGTISRGKWNGTIVFAEAHLTDPLRWQRPRRVFVNSMSDLFHPALGDADRDRIFAVMALAGRHQFQVLTKRPGEMYRYVTALGTPGGAARLEAAARTVGHTTRFEGHPLVRWPIPNLWLGVSVEDQGTALQRIPLLVQTAAAVRFVSAEPLIDQLDLRPWLQLREVGRGPALDWVIVGGESGPHARPCRLGWVRRVTAQCQAEGVACFVKQLGKVAIDGAGRAIDQPVALDLRHPKGGDPSEWPADLRVQEWPLSDR